MDYQTMLTKVLSNDDDKMDTDNSQYDSDDSDELMNDFNTMKQENSLPEMINEWHNVSQPFLLNSNNVSNENHGHNKLLIDWDSRQMYQEDSV